MVAAAQLAVAGENAQKMLRGIRYARATRRVPGGGSRCVARMADITPTTVNYTVSPARPTPLSPLTTNGYVSEKEVSGRLGGF